MSQIVRSITLLMLVMGFMGCASLNSIHRNHDFTKKSAFIDVKQRAILAKGSGDALMMCAEPSPDAMSAYAAELAAKAKFPEAVAAEFAGAFQESSAYVGLRTQSIQLLRDRSYRLCEARMNGFISNGQFELQMRREQRNTVALLAIEQLTGALKVPTVTINTKGTAEIARNVDELVAQKEEKDKEIAAKNKEKDAIDKKTEGAQAKINALEKEITELEKSRDILTEGIKNDRSMVATGSATAVVHAAGMPTQRDDTHIQSIAKQVGQIVKETQTDDFGQMCLLKLEKNPSGFLSNICTDYLNGVGRQQEALTTIMKTFSMKLSEVKIKNAQDIKTLAEALKLLSDFETGSGIMGVQPTVVKSTIPNEQNDKKK